MSFLGKIGDAVKTFSTGGFASTDVARAVPGIGDRIATQEANEQNVRLDKMNRDWMERMSNSAYQRGMEDMKKAGLNPMLAYQQGGASVPTTTAPTADAASATGLFDAGLKAFTGISNTQTAKQQANTAQAQAESGITLQTAQTAQEVAKTDVAKEDAKLKQVERKIKERELRGKGAKDVIDIRGGKIIDSILDKVENTMKTSAKPDASKFWQALKPNPKPVEGINRDPKKDSFYRAH